jgi:hypothetical protein
VDVAGQATLARAGLTVGSVQRPGSEAFRFFRAGESEPEMALHTPKFLQRLGLYPKLDECETNRTVMIGGLVGALRERNVRFDTGCTGCTGYGGGGVWLLGGEDGGVALGDFDVAVDASGVRAALRRSHFTVESDAHYTGITVVQGVIASPEASCSPEFVRCLGEGTAHYTGPSADGEGVLFFNVQRFGADPNDKRAMCSLFIPSDDLAAVAAELGFRASGEQSDLAKARAFFAEQLSSQGWSEDIRAAAATIAHCRVLPIFMHGFADAVEEVGGDVGGEAAGIPVLGIGDALHALPPWSGMSGNFALADAADCADALIAAITSTPNRAEGAALVETLRALEARFLKRADAPRLKSLAVEQCFRKVWPKTKYEDYRISHWLTGAPGMELVDGGKKIPRVVTWGIEQSFAFFSFFHKREGWGMPRSGGEDISQSIL